MADDDYVTIGNTGGSQGGIAGGPKNKLPGFLQKLFGDLTNSQVQIPGQPVQYSQDQSQLAQTASKSLPSADAMLGPDVMNPSPTSQAPMPSQIQTPSFADANQVGGVPGVGAVGNPNLTTKGKVLATLISGAFGALAGAGQKTAGEGFSAGEQLPFIQAMRRQEVLKSQLENQFSRMQLSQMNTPVKMGDGSSMPLWQAMQQGKYNEVQASIAQKKSEVQKNKFVTPRNGGVYDTGTQQYAPGTEPQDKPQNVDQMISSRLQDVLRSGGDPRTDQQLQQMIQTKQSSAANQGKPDNPEQQFTDEYQRRNPGSSIQQAQRAYVQNQHVTDPTASNNTRADKSYQFNVGQLNTIGKPITDRVTRLSTLQDTINQATPQADALVAPELLTVMAGGQGSGLRMNEAEISRIVGGRAAWESIKAAANKWQTDPRKGLSITPAQRGQIRALMQAVYGKLQQKQNILDQAQQDLINTDDPTQHRRIVAGVRQKMTTIDQGQSGASGGGNPLDRFWKQ
jgi:hypothetical protein